MGFFVENFVYLYKRRYIISCMKQPMTASEMGKKSVRLRKKKFGKNFRAEMSRLAKIRWSKAAESYPQKEDKTS